LKIFYICAEYLVAHHKVFLSVFNYGWIIDVIRNNHIARRKDGFPFFTESCGVWLAER
jgi:hypothetical protein